MTAQALHVLARLSPITLGFRRAYQALKNRLSLPACGPLIANHLCKYSSVVFQVALRVKTRSAFHV